MTDPYDPGAIKSDTASDFEVAEPGQLGRIYDEIWSPGLPIAKTPGDVGQDPGIVGRPQVGEVQRRRVDPPHGLTGGSGVLGADDPVVEPDSSSDDGGATTIFNNRPALRRSFSFALCEDLGFCIEDWIIESYRGDGICDDGSYGVYLNCAEFGYDDGD